MNLDLDLKLRTDQVLLELEEGTSGNHQGEVEDLRVQILIEFKDEAYHLFLINTRKRRRSQRRNRLTRIQ